MIAGFRSSLFRSEAVPSQVLCGIHWLLHHLIVGIHARPHHNYDEDQRSTVETQGWQMITTFKSAIRSIYLR